MEAASIEKSHEFSFCNGRFPPNGCLRRTNPASRTAPTKGPRKFESDVCMHGLASLSK